MLEGQTFTVGVDTDGRPLGLSFDFMDPQAGHDGHLSMLSQCFSQVCAVAAVARGSLIEQWNLHCSPLERVAPRDRLRKALRALLQRPVCAR